MTITRPMRRVLRAIRDDRPWQARHETVERILRGGFAVFADGGWTLTAKADAILLPTTNTKTRN